MKTHNHFISEKVALGVGISLLVLTVITVAVARVDLGVFNFLVAMFVATLKASLVTFYFMGLKYESKDNKIIFFGSFIFLALFFILAATDFFFRPRVMINGPFFKPVVTQGPHFKKPWISSKELIKHGKELFANYCISCHGANGAGDGPAAAALSPTPRNFHQSSGWKNGRTVAGIFKTLQEGLPPSAMASYATVPAEDRLALTHFVISLNSDPVQESTEVLHQKLAGFGIDTSKETIEAVRAPSVPVDFIIESSVDQAVFAQKPILHYTFSESTDVGKSLYVSQCASCHGLDGQGGVYIEEVLTVSSLLQSKALASEELFNQRVLKGYPGSLMVGFSSLDPKKLHSLYRYIQSLKK